jgi:hypothetical protein
MVPHNKVRHLLACAVFLSTASVAVCQDNGARLATPVAIEKPPVAIEKAPVAVDGGQSAGNRWESSTSNPSPFAPARNESTLINGNHGFDNFIGFISNPVQSVDPRAISELYPIFGAGWASGNSPLLPDASAQLYGVGLTVALSDRFAVGLNQGGYAVMDINSARERLREKLGLPVSDRDRGGNREGWLNLGGFAQYTLIADVPNQSILTAGMRWEAPSGTEQVFQGGASPTYLSPYLTAGQAFGCWHVLGTAGFEFPVGNGTSTTDTYYLNVHIDRQIGWLYPLVEFNGSYHDRTVDLSVPTHHGVIDLGTFSSSGNLLEIAVGANAVIVPGKLEVGAVYIRPISSQDHFDFNSLLLKMTYRF